jgi:hypothetical protein
MPLQVTSHLNVQATVDIHGTSKSQYVAPAPRPGGMTKSGFEDRDVMFLLGSYDVLFCLELADVVQAIALLRTTDEGA